MILILKLFLIYSAIWITLLNWAEKIQPIPIKSGLKLFIFSLNIFLKLSTSFSAVLASTWKVDFNILCNNSCEPAVIAPTSAALCLFINILPLSSTKASKSPSWPVASTNSSILSNVSTFSLPATSSTIATSPSINLLLALARTLSTLFVKDLLLLDIPPLADPYCWAVISPLDKDSFSSIRV